MPGDRCTATFGSISVMIDGVPLKGIKTIDYKDAAETRVELQVTNWHKVPAEFESTMSPTEASDVMSVLSGVVSGNLKQRLLDRDCPRLAEMLDRGELRVVGYNGEAPDRETFSLVREHLVAFDEAAAAELARLEDGGE